MELVIRKQALKALNRMQPTLRDAIKVELKRIALDPFGSHPHVKPMAGFKDAFRLRHRHWRVLYVLDRQSQTMRVEWVKPRGDAYR
jgi:mRNA-degrading endonuclease RelE of RelBE toxin-antitoxin system